MTTPVATPQPVHAAEKAPRYVALLFLVSTVSLMDRQILAILLEPKGEQNRVTFRQKRSIQGWSISIGTRAHKLD